MSRKAKRMRSAYKISSPRPFRTLNKLLPTVHNFIHVTSHSRTLTKRPLSRNAHKLSPPMSRAPRALRRSDRSSQARNGKVRGPRQHMLELRVLTTKRHTHPNYCASFSLHRKNTVIRTCHSMELSSRRICGIPRQRSWLLQRRRRRRFMHGAVNRW